jgi:hypothetical protein
MLQSVLGDRAFIVSNYVDRTVELAKSMLLINSYEAKALNSYIEDYYPGYPINSQDKSTWRYYKHLAGELHPLDTPVYLKSIDNLTTIELNRTNLILFKKTKEELLKFGKYYKEVAAAYPGYEIYIKAVISDSIYTLDELITLPNFTIVCYNQLLIEENELDIIEEMQARLKNYAVSWNISYYSKSDTLFLATQFSVLYLFIVKSFIAIRLRNAKTIKAHSFHIKNYLSSHHYLDEYYRYLNPKQRLFFYRNLLYIDNHVGSNETFELIIKKLFIERKIPIATFTYTTSNTIDDDRNPTYSFKKKHFDKTKDPYSYSLNDVIDKENKIVKGNLTEWDVVKDKTNVGLSNTLFNYLTTKDLETYLFDYTDNVKHKLLETILDYTAYTCKMGISNFNVKFTNASNTTIFNIPIRDAFKLLIVLLYRYNNEPITIFPEYRVTRVRKNTLPSVSLLLGKLYRRKYYHKSEIERIQSHFNPYPAAIVSNYNLYDFVNKEYLLNMGLWFYLTNESDINDEGQFTALIEEHYTSDIYNVGSETVTDFISRIGITEIYDYAREEDLLLFTTIVNSIFDNQYNDLLSAQFAPKALIGVFSKFKSYTVQIVGDYMNNNITLGGQKDCRYGVDIDINSRVYALHNRILVENLYSESTEEVVTFNTDFTETYAYTGTVSITPETNITSEAYVYTNLPIYLQFNTLYVDPPEYMITPSTQEDLIFLATNLI